MERSVVHGSVMLLMIGLHSEPHDCHILAGVDAVGYCAYKDPSMLLH